MDKIKPEKLYDPRLLDQALFQEAKIWWVISTICRLIVYMFSILIIFWGIWPEISPLVATFLSITSELLLWQSDRVKDISERLLRKLDMHDSFGWEISGAEMSDLLLDVSKRTRMRAHNGNVDHNYFSSKEFPGVLRALENLQESAWWSKHLARKSGFVYLWLAVISVVLSITLVIVSIETVPNYSVLSNIGRTVTATIALLFSV